MILYIFYRIGHFLAMTLPLEGSYGLARLIAGIHYRVCRKDRKSVMKNLKVIMGNSASEEDLDRTAREVFVNFAKYLVDFFRFSEVDEEYIKKHVRIEGLDNVDKALSGKKGVILLSAHMGNWELGGLVASLLRHPMCAVVLTHKYAKTNDFFKRQRSTGNMKPVEIGMGLRDCYNCLKNNGLLAVLGDRDFSKRGCVINFFGRKTQVPKGPAVFSYRTGASIVPCFMIRNSDDTFKLVFEEPIFSDKYSNEESAVGGLIEKYSVVIESYVRRYPGQWYMFQEVWNGNGE